MANIINFHNDDLLTEEELQSMNEIDNDNRKMNSHERDIERRLNRDIIRKQNNLAPLEDGVALFQESILAALEDEDI